MALTLIEAAKIALGRDEAYEATVMELYARSSDVLRVLPFDNISGNALTFNREAVLPNIAFRGVNEGYTAGEGKLDQITESLAIAGGDLDVDKFLVDTGGADQRAVQEGLKIKALSLNMTKEIVKGDATTSKTKFDGLQVRCIGDMLIDAGATASGDALSLLKLDEMIDAVEDPTYLLMNKTMRRLLTAAARTTGVSGYITYSKDEFGRQITLYNDLPILIADKDNTNTDILPFTEVCPGGGSNLGTSIYCMSTADNGVVGLQNGGMGVRDLGEIDTKPVYRTRIEWYITLAIMRPRAASRLYGIKNAAVTA